VTRRSVAQTHANIALAKYWGKRDVAANVPAVPSLSVTLEGMRTITSIALAPDLTADTFELNGEPAPALALARTVTLLDRVRAAAGSADKARVVSHNDFPTSSGLASSASGFAALAVAAAHAFGLDWSPERVSDLARRSSASAARSVFGGFVELGCELPASGVLGASVVAPADHLDVRVLVCVTSEGAKAVASTDGMRRTAERSPYYAAWVERAPLMFSSLKAALLARDLEQVGELTEASALAMHASAMAAAVVYVTGATLQALAQVRELRARGYAAWATMDAGPHVKVLVSAADAAAVRASMVEVPGVLRVLEARPGHGATVVADDAS
jgi:diphosphomevalonate decarboxylase